jgi:hemerythrin
MENQVYPTPLKNKYRCGDFPLNSSDLFLWTDDLSVATQSVDEQHRNLIGLINQLHAAIRDHHGQDIAREILDALTESAQAHFMFEEGLMRLTFYAGYAAHKAQHETMMEEMRALQDALDDKSATINVELLHSHKNWWEQHIRVSDRSFSAHYEKSGLGEHAKTRKGAGGPAEKKLAWWKFW